MLYVSRKNHHVEEVYDETRMYNMRRAASLKKTDGSAVLSYAWAGTPRDDGGFVTDRL